MMKIIISHLATVMEKPAIPLAPNTKAMNARIMNNTARPIRSGIVTSNSPLENLFLNIVVVEKSPNKSFTLVIR